MKESETLELKKSTSELKEAVISISSILNKSGRGELYFGIKDDGTILGQVIGKNTLRDVSQAISNHIEPRIYPKIEKKQINGKDCVHVIFEGNDSPYYAYGRVYIRSSDQDLPLNPKEIERIIIEKNTACRYWDYQKSSSTIGDIDKSEIERFLESAKKAGRLESKKAEDKVILDKLGLLDGNKLRNAGQILFCSNNLLEVQLAVFAGGDKTTFLDIRQLKGNLFELMREAMLYFKSNIHWSVNFSGLERKEYPEIPLKAFREALVNSFCHRDYVNPKGNEIAIFKDRVEIYNPGSFPKGLKPEDYIRGEERSVLRNPLIANVLYLSKDIEKWGSGLKRIFEECQDAGVTVEFKTLKTGFLTIFYRMSSHKTTDKTADKTTDKTADKKLSDNEQAIIDLIISNPRISQKEMSKRLGLTVDGIRYHTDKLKKKGVLERGGGKKSGYWIVKK